MADMQKTVAGKKLNSRILTQFFSYNICLTSQTSSSTFFFKMAAMHKMAAYKKANHQILTQFVPSNMLTTM